MTTAEAQVAIIGGGVVGCAVAHALARTGVAAVLFEREPALARGASGSNSGILHTGFDSHPGGLETELILRSAALREPLLAELAVTVWRCGAQLRPEDDDERAAVRALAENAARNGVEAHLQPDGSLLVPGESVTDPVAFVQALAGAACNGGARVLLGARVSAIGAASDGALIELSTGERWHAGAIVNCAGLFADEIAELAGEHPVSVYPRKGEFLVFANADEQRLERILLPVPSALGKGVLVFPTIDRHVVAGPTAREREDKHDWSVEADAEDLIVPRATRMYPALAGARRIGSYAGLRPAGRERNYAIEASARFPGLIHVAAIRSTGLSASLGIGEHVAALLAEQGVITLGRPRPLLPPPCESPTEPWWQRAARDRESR